MRFHFTAVRSEGGMRATSTAGPWPAGDSRPRSRRDPGVIKPSARDPYGPSERDSLATTVTITAQRSMRSGTGQPQLHIARQPPGPIAERSGTPGMARPN
jgi:hypothetical protein